jgi:hypothetical protein
MGHALTTAIEDAIVRWCGAAARVGTFFYCFFGEPLISSLRAGTG